MTEKGERRESRCRRVGHRWILTQSAKFLLVTVFLSGVVTKSVAEISSPPMIIVGSLATEGGLEVTSGVLQFAFIPEEGTRTVKVDAKVGTFEKNMNFHVYVPMETVPLNPGTEGIRLGVGLTYTLQVHYDGEPIADVQIDSPITASAGEVFGPLNYTVSPKGAAFSVSDDLSFGFVSVGESAPKNFQINNVGTEDIVGVAHILKAIHFTIQDQSVVEGRLPIELMPGESMTVQVRFSPVSRSDSLNDTFRVETGIGDVDRSLSGYSAGPEESATMTPIPTATPTMDFDENDDTKVNSLDLIFFLGTVKSGNSDHSILFSFSQHWMQE